MKTKPYGAFPWLFALALGACGEKNAAPPGSASTTLQAAATAPASVRTTDAQKKFLAVQAVGSSQTPDFLALPGRVVFRPQAQSSVGATVAGQVVGLHVRAGEAVRAGAPVLTIESADASATRAAVDQAATRLASAESVLRRNVEMVEKGVGLEHERLEAEVRLKEARTEYERARQSAGLIGARRGGRVTVTAPTNGVVISIRVSVGATVAPGGEPLLELGDPSQLQIVAQAAESDLGRIALGQPAEVELPGLNTRVAARVDAITPRVESESRRLQIYLTPAGQPGPGQVARDRRRPRGPRRGQPL